MRVASQKTLEKNKKIRFSYADRVIERDSMSGDESVQEKADAAMSRLNRHEMSKEEMLEWALKEQEWRLLNA